MLSWLVTKYAITAFAVVAISEIAKRSDKFGGFVAALPLITILTMIWLYVEKQPDSKIAQHAYYTFWYVIPTLPMFYLFPFMMEKGGFWLALAGSIILTVICFWIFAMLLKPFDINLL